MLKRNEKHNWKLNEFPQKQFSLNSFPAHTIKKREKKAANKRDTKHHEGEKERDKSLVGSNIAEEREEKKHQFQTPC